MRTPILTIIFTYTTIVMANSYFSPNKSIELIFKLNNKGEFLYQIKYKNIQVIKESRLGLELKDTQNFLDGFEILKIDTSSFQEFWTPIWGEVDKIKNNYHQVLIKLYQPKTNRILNINFRLFDDGVGFRYEFPNQEKLQHFIIKEERSQFALTGDHIVFWIPGDYDSQEYTYTKSNLSQINALKGKSYYEIYTKTIPGENFVQTPLLIKTIEGLYLNIHEASLLNYPAYYLSIDKKNYLLETHLCPDAIGNKAYIQAPFNTPWRTIIISDKAEEILASKIILNLNEPPKHDDLSWIKPKKYIGIWWGMHVGIYTWNYADASNIKINEVDWTKLKANGRHGATTQRAKQYIDFAAKHGFDAVLIEGWNIGWEDWFGKWKEDVFDFVTPYPDFDVDEVSRYAMEKNVELIMHHETSSSVTNYERRLNDAFNFLKKYNYTTIKTGYVGPIIPRGEHHDGQWMVNHYNRVVEKAMKEKICINSHESVRLTGLHRTYPNWLSAEAARGNEFNAWSSGNPPEHETILPFTRLIGGPMDYTPGIFQIKLDYYNPNNKFQVNTTLAKQLALYVVIYSPLQMAADLPENYERFPDAFQFIKDVPVNWKDTKILFAEPGDYVVIARKDKNSENWFIGAITDENSREFYIKTDFLSDGNYLAEIYKDSETASWHENPISYEIEKKRIDKNSILKLKLAPGGGCAIAIKKID